MSDTEAGKQPMPVDGGAAQKGTGKDTAGQMASGGESGGQAYPNDAPSAEEGGFLGHGGQSRNAYHGGNQLGEETADEARAAHDRAR